MFKQKKTAVIVLTPGAKNIALKLKGNNPKLDLYFSERLIDQKNDFKTFSSLKKLTARIFSKYDALVFIMSLGIVVRVVADLLESKKSDPAVITIDEKAENVISTLSGHLGGANKLTVEIAEILKSKPVITTATDANNKLAVDLLAERLNCTIEPFQRLKKANSALLFNEQLHIFTDYSFKIKADPNIKKFALAELKKKTAEKVFQVIISNQIFELKKNQIQLIPKNIVIGIGCRKNISFIKLKRNLKKFLKKHNLKKKSIKSLATIDLKKDEKAILKLAETNDWPLSVIERSEIKKIEADLELEKSDFVKKITGIAAAAAPAAILASKSKNLIIDKNKYSGITLAAVEEDIINE